MEAFELLKRTALQKRAASRAVEGKWKMTCLMIKEPPTNSIHLMRWQKKITRQESPCIPLSVVRLRTVGTRGTFFISPPFCLLCFALWGGEGPERGAHLELHEPNGACNVLDRGTCRESWLFSFSCPQWVYVVAVPYSLPRKWVLLIGTGACQASVTYGLREPMWRCIVGNFSQINLGERKTERKTFSWGPLASAWSQLGAQCFSRASVFQVLPFNWQFHEQ